MKKLIIIILLIIGTACFSRAADTLSPSKRIVSLAPSTTEILFALGLGDRVIGVTSFCDHPEEAKSKPKIGGMSNPSLEAIVLMKPDIVVMTTDGNPKEVEERLRSLKISTYVFTARRILELPQAIRDMGKALQVREKADRVAREMEASIKRLGVRSQETGDRRSSPPSASLLPPHSSRKVLFIVWPEPLIVAGPGTAIDDAITLLGCDNIASRTRSTYPKYSIEEVIHQAPDVVFIGRGTGMDMQAVSQGLLQKMASVPAVRNRSVFFVGDGLYRLGPRVVAGIEELAECLP